MSFGVVESLESYYRALTCQALAIDVNAMPFADGLSPVWHDLP